MKKKYEELRNQSAQETIDQEKQRITRNIGRLKGQIKELIEENKDLEDHLGSVSQKKPDKATKLVQEVRELRKQQARIHEAQSSGDAFAIMERNIRHYYHTMGYDMDEDVKQLMEDTEAYAAKPDPQVYLASGDCRLFKNALILSLLAAEYLDFDNVAKKYNGEEDWPTQVATYMSKDKRFSKFMPKSEMVEGLRSYQSAGLELKALPEHFELLELASELASRQDVVKFSKHGGGQSNSRRSLQAFAEQHLDEGGLGVESEDQIVDLAAVADYTRWPQSQLENEAKRKSAMAALSLIMVDAGARSVKVGWLLGYLADQAEASVDKRGHHLANGKEGRYNGGTGVKHSKMFDKSSELKLKEEEIPITDGQDHRRSETNLDDDQKQMKRQLLQVIAASGYKDTGSLLSVSMSTSDRASRLLGTLQAAIKSSSKYSSVKYDLDNRSIGKLFDSILSIYDMKSATVYDQNEVLAREINFKAATDLPSHSDLIVNLQKGGMDNKQMTKHASRVFSGKSTVAIGRLGELLNDGAVRLREDKELLAVEAYLLNENEGRFEMRVEKMIDCLTRKMQTKEEKTGQVSGTQAEPQDNDEFGNEFQDVPVEKSKEKSKQVKAPVKDIEVNEPEKKQDNEVEFDDYGEFDDGDL